MSIIRMAMREKDQIEEKGKTTIADYNRFRLLEEILFIYFKDARMGWETFSEIYHGNTRVYNGIKYIDYNKDYYAEEMLN